MLFQYRLNVIALQKQGVVPQPAFAVEQLCRRDGAAQVGAGHVESLITSSGLKPFCCGFTFSFPSRAERISSTSSFVAELAISVLGWCAVVSLG